MISARNKIKATVTEVKNGAVNAVVKLDAGNGINLSAVITMDSVNDLGLSAGKTCYATVKASEVMLANDKLKISARNQIEGTITEIKKGAVNAVVKLDAAGDVKVTSVITMDSVNDLGLDVGKKAVAIIKSSSVMITVE